MLIFGFIQGIGTEAGFFINEYKRYDTVTLIYGAIGTTIFSFAYEFFKFGYSTYGVIMIISLFLVHFVSVAFLEFFNEANSFLVQ